MTIAMLKKGVAAWNEWGRENPDIRPDHSDANLSMAMANLGGGNLTGADLEGVLPAAICAFDKTLKELCQINNEISGPFILKLGDPDLMRLAHHRDSHCKNVRRSNGIWKSCSDTEHARMSQCLRRLYYCSFPLSKDGVKYQYAP